MADEPTGSLEEETEIEILKLFLGLKAKGYRFIIVTHNKAVAEICEMKYMLENRRQRADYVMLAITLSGKK